MSRCLEVAVVLALCGGAGCGASRKLVYRPDELRELVRERAPGIPPGEIVVPFEISEAHAALARRIVRDAPSDAEEVRRLTAAIVDPKLFGLRYVPSVTTGAEETIRKAEGNCLALASVFIGLARAAGLEAYYMDASIRVHETRYAQDGTTVNEGHVSAMVKTPSGNFGLDFARLGTIQWYRVLDDVEALANYYNNRGFELMDRAEAEGVAVDWPAVEREYRLAVKVMPTFARAWNNLGVAAARLGHRPEAMADYRAAIASDPRLAAPHNNLGELHLAAGEIEPALRELEAAARLDPRAPHVQYHLALARLRHGDRVGAQQALRRAISLRGDYPEARALLAELAPGAAAGGAQPGSGGSSAGSVSSNQ
ncbi:MAG TPA: tetratricopeptide repeat protein [Anaeromyxobacteraceae bacterium]